MALTDTIALAAARLVPEKFRRPAWLRPRYPLVAVEAREDALVRHPKRRWSFYRGQPVWINHSMSSRRQGTSGEPAVFA